MSTEIVRTIEHEDKTIHVHIHLSQSEVNRLLLPLITSAFMTEMQRSIWQSQITSAGTTERSKL